MAVCPVFKAANDQKPHASFGFGLNVPKDYSNPSYNKTYCNAVHFTMFLQALPKCITIRCDTWL
jgi:hypothetical protein